MSENNEPVLGGRRRPVNKVRPGALGRKPKRNLPKVTKGGAIGYALFLVFAGVPALIWFGCRIEPGSNEIAILTHKMGDDLPSGRILALAENEKGVQLDVLPEGRYFKNPLEWDWEIDRISDIPAGKLGILTRLYGVGLERGKIIADEQSKGIVAEVLRPGKYRINPYAYHLEMFDAIEIRPGHVGVVTTLVGSDVLNTEVAAEHENGFLVNEGEKGVINKVLDPGTYYLNPYMVNVSEVNLQSQRFEMSGADVISFLTLDGFTVSVEGTIEFAINRDRAALLTHQVGEMDDIVKKVILPRARGFSRIEGSKHPAINFIVGETRQEFQDVLEGHLIAQCEEWGLDVKSVLVRKIIPPDEIASINRDREVAVQDANKYNQQIAQAQSKAELAKQEMLAVQNKEKVEADTLRIKAVILAQQESAVKVISAEKDLDVSRVDLQASRFKAEGITLQAKGAQDGIRAHNEADAEVLKLRADAFGSGANLSRFVMYEKMGPRIKTILSDDSKEGLGAIFKPFLPTGKGGAQ